MSLHVLCIGAHPDDNEGSIGGTIALLRRRGASVRMLSVTEGSKGHFDPIYRRSPQALVRRREAEARAAAALVGAEYVCLGQVDGEVEVNLANTLTMVRAIRSFGEEGQGPDLVLLNRPNDYHRDHRYSAQLALDAAYLLTVPFTCPETPALRRMPVFAYWWDTFTEGGAFRADVVVPIDRVVELKTDMVCCHESQFYEWLPYNSGAHEALAAFPSDPAERRKRVSQWWLGEAAAVRNAHADRLPPDCRYAEAFQISEYGRRPSADEIAHLFPVSGE